MTSEVPCVKFVMAMLSVSSPLRIGLLPLMDPEEQGAYNGNIQDPGLDALLQWLGELWWWWQGWLV